MSTQLTPTQAAQQALAKQQSGMAERLAGLGSGESKSFVKGKAGHWIFPDGSRIPRELPIVILDWAFQYSYWKNPYVQGQSESPDCFAVGQNVRTMEPSSNAPDIQNDGPCATCPQNQFGSGGGNRKACKNTVVIAFHRYDDEIDDDTIYFLSIPPSALKNWHGFVSKLAEHNRAPAQVVTVVGFDDKVDYPKPVFSADRDKTAEYLEEDEDGSSYFSQYVQSIDKATQALLREPTSGDD